MEKTYEKINGEIFEKTEKAVSREEIENRILGFQQDVVRLTLDIVNINAEIEKLENALK